MKSWSYRQVTKAAETAIRRSMKLASEHADNAYVHRCFAYGVYQCWSELTLGWQKPGDAERLRELCEERRVESMPISG